MGGDDNAEQPVAAGDTPPPRASNSDNKDTTRSENKIFSPLQQQDMAIDVDEEDDMKMSKRRSSVASIRMSFRARSVRAASATADQPNTQSLYFDSKILNTKPTAALKRVQDKLNGCDRFN